MKKAFKLAAVAAASALALSACGFGGSAESGSGGGGANAPISLLVPSYSDGTKARWEKIIADYKAANPGREVTLEIQSWDNINDVVRTKVQSNQTPDILGIDAFAAFAEDDLLYPAKDVVSPEVLADFQPGFANNAKLGDEQYGLPWIATTRTLFYNNALMKQAGVAAVPKTWDELYAAAEKVQALGNGVSGYGLPLGKEEAQGETAIWAFGNGGGFGDQNALTMDSPQNVEGVAQIKRFADGKVTQPNPGSTNRTPLLNVFIQGKIGFIVGIPPIVGEIATKNPSLDYGVAPVATKTGEPATLGVADHLMAFKNDGSKQEAVKGFLDYVYSKDVYSAWVGAEGFLPTTTSGGETFAGDEKLKPFLDSMPYAKFYPSTNKNWPAAQADLQSQIGLVATGREPAEILGAIQRDAQG